ncbi:hypothetical protein BDZ89DRAFT_1169119 [Hymenopellis radicata]|nr:hypothetical protein BDZ89DRAFT_1169119 [Hymenopellis radicata]
MCSNPPETLKMPEDNSEPIHGLAYPPSFLDSLRKVSVPSTYPRFVSAPTSPRPDHPAPEATDGGIPLLPPAALAELHVAHLTAHAPDHVLFPFLHGVEGDNVAQNTFFYGAKAVELAAPVPRYRGLIYVVCDEDLDGDLDSEEEDEEDETEDGESDMDIDGDSGMDLDLDLDDEVVVREGEEDIVIEGVTEEKKEGVKHMHPVVMKPAPPILPPPPSYTNGHRRPPRIAPPLLTSTFTPGELLRRGQGEAGWEFVPLKVPDGISLRNFGIQVPIMATISDIVVYSPRGPESPSARRLAARFREAMARKRKEREERLGGTEALLDYNVFLLDAGEEEMRDEASPLKHLVKGVGNTVNFAEREKEEMRALTRASELLRVYPQGYDSGLKPGDNEPPYGQIILGNSNDVPMPGEGNAGAYDLCIECHDLAPYPSSAHLRAAEDKLSSMEAAWLDEDETDADNTPKTRTVRPPPDANDVIHLPFPSSPPNTGHIRPLVRFLERWVTPVPIVVDQPPEAVPEEKQKEKGREKEKGGRRWTLLSGAPSFPPLFGSSTTPGATIGGGSSRIRSFTSPAPPPRAERARPAAGLLPPSRPLKVLIYSADGYTESSVLALCLLMALKGLTLPEAYLELQCEVGGIEGDGRGGPGRSFFVYAGDLGVLRRWENEERGERERKGRSSVAPPKHESPVFSGVHTRGESMGVGVNPYVAGWGVGDGMSLSMPDGGVVERTPQSAGVLPAPVAVRRVGRPRAATLPASLGWDHQAWFDDPRFDGSFPSRVLDYLYLGNLNHASNVYMLHALGITHVVSVGECALVPPGPPTGASCAPHDSSAGLSTHYMPAPGPNVTTNGHVHGRAPRRGSLWAEERAGRIKVLDIQGVCDDGIDTLEPQLAPICDWMDGARAGTPHAKILVHCRVGVSRSATVVIAYVMRALGMSLVEAYLVVRSRRLSVLIQPNMRLLWNLCGWEVRLARERAGRSEAGGGKEDLGGALRGAVAWPWLAREVHRLNEKYLH